MFGLNQGWVWGKLSAELNLVEEKIPQSQWVHLHFQDLQGPAPPGVILSTVLGWGIISAFPGTERDHGRLRVQFAPDILSSGAEG